MYHMLNATRNFIAEELLAQIYAEVNISAAMEESPQELERKTELLNIFHSLKEAVKIIGDINISTHSTPTPAAVDYNWVQVFALPSFNSIFLSFTLSFSILPSLLVLIWSSRSLRALETFIKNQGGFQRLSISL